MSNVIQLAFNTSNHQVLTQSLNLMLDSRAMKVIAAMTLVFIPIKLNETGHVCESRIVLAERPTSMFCVSWYPHLGLAPQW